MPSSISNSDLQVSDAGQNRAKIGSDNQRLRHATISLLVLLFGLLCFAELSARFLFPRVSRIQRRAVQDQREVMALRQPSAGTTTTVLLVGNSLLAHGLDYPTIRVELAPHVRVIRYAIEQTSYLDWYYGLRRLFAEGVRPSRVALFLNLGATVDSKILGDYSARYLFQASDLLAVARDTHLDRTETSSLIFSHWSAFYASRATIRNYILNVTDHGYDAAIHEIAIQPAPMPPEEEALSIVRPRLQALKQLCMQNHSDFTFVIPPAISRKDAMLLRAGVLESVDVVAPVELGRLGPEFYQDRFHLNANGAKMFTDALVGEIRARLPLRP